MSDIAWWFAAADTLPHGDGRKVVIGGTLDVKPPLVICEHGLHWCRHPFDALKYANGPLLYKVRPGGQIIEGSDKGCSAERTALAMRDATDMLWLFARRQALKVIHRWDAPEVMRRFLETGDEALRTAANDAAWSAAPSVARDAAMAATRVAGSGHASDTSWVAARVAARVAAWVTARVVAIDAAVWATARVAAREMFAEMVEELFAEEPQ